MHRNVHDWTRALPAILLSICLSACGGGDNAAPTPSTTTSTAPSTTLPDTTAPSVSSVSPATSASGIALNTRISVTFNEPMDTDTVDANSFYLSVGVDIVPGSYSSNGNTFTFIPEAALLRNTTYTLYVNDRAKDAAGNTLATVYSSTFTTAWTQQYGSSSNEYVAGIAADADGNQYVTGYTYGSLGSSNAGGADVFLTKFNSSGVQQWIRQLGSNVDDFASNVAVDKASGAVYVVGYTLGSLGAANAGGYDYFLAKYDAAGAQTWIKQSGSSSIDIAYALSIDSGNIYITGNTLGSLPTITSAAEGSDMFFVKYDASGNEIIKKQFYITTSGGATGVAVANSYAVAIDSNGIYFGGDIGTPGFNQQVGIYALENSGSSRWLATTGTANADEKVLGMTLDGDGNLYATGLSYGPLFGSLVGSSDLFVVKYDKTTGAVLWQKQYGTSSYDNGLALVFQNGALYLTGSTGGSLVSGQYVGGNDVFLQKIDPSDGTVTWSRQFGSIANDDPAGLDLDGSGNIYIAGTTHAGLGGNTHRGGGDLFIVKYDAAGNRL